MESPFRGSESAGAPRGGRRRARDDERGAALVEAALLLPFLMLIIFGIIEFGLLLSDHNSVTTAAGVAARTASAEPKASSFGDDAKDKAAGLISSIARRESTATDPDKIVVYQAVNIPGDVNQAAGSITTVIGQGPGAGTPGCALGSANCVDGQGADGVDPALCGQVGGPVHCLIYEKQGGSWTLMNGTPGANGYWDFTQEVNACPLPDNAANYFDTRTRVGVYVQVTHDTMSSFMSPILGSLRRVTRNVVYRLEPLPSSKDCTWGHPA